MADYYNKTVMICGLDGDYQRQPFGDILKLIPHAEDVLKLYSINFVTMEMLLLSLND